MNNQFLNIELGLTVSGFMLFAVIFLILVAGILAIGMGVQRRWGR